MAILPVGAAFAETAGGSIEGVRANLQKWVETRQLTSRLETDWQAEKEMLEQTAALFEKELADLSQQIDKAETGTSQIDKERTELEREKAELDDAKAKVSEWATRLEGRLTGLSKTWPKPLASKLDPLIRRLPEDPANTRVSPVERLQTVVGILNEVEKFHSVIAVESELQKKPDGKEVEVKTLYVGLGQAYFVDKTGGFAGVGVPTLEGWQWEERSALGKVILHAIEVYEGTQPPSFDGLPMTVN